MKINTILKSSECKSENCIEVLLIYKDESIEVQHNSLQSIIQGFDYTYKNIEKIKYISEETREIILVGLGDKRGLTTERVRVLSAELIRQLKKTTSKVPTFINLKELNMEGRILEAFIEGMILGDYNYDKYKTIKGIQSFSEVNIKVNSNQVEYVESGEMLANCSIISKNLINEPANFMTPEILAKEVKKLGEIYKFNTKIHGIEEIEKLNMGAFLSVAKGSNNSPKLIVMKYNGAEDNEEVIGLIGKGVTFDSGGYSLKRTPSMVDMKTDMGGAGAVIGAMCLLASKKVKKNVVGVIAACENLISSKAYKPGDIITSMEGKTIEVLNTDCEGRLTLVDALTYTIEIEKASKVLTIATLTGAAMTATGGICTPVISNDKDFYKILKKASEVTDEKIWEMPNYDEYKEMIVGDIADLKNVGGKYGGCTSAGLFIGEFAKQRPWIHMDIAGTVSIGENKGYKSKGATGVGTKILYCLTELL